mmetsp:Transcript_20116/g.60217  ORF Transcript_20116/g.60217 Transcript_20116/m.60217 type:complete len:203 (+) Transcript_20116:2246-2854(+)
MSCTVRTKRFAMALLDSYMKFDIPSVGRFFSAHWRATSTLAAAPSYLCRNLSSLVAASAAPRSCTSLSGNGAESPLEGAICPSPGKRAKRPALANEAGYFAFCKSASTSFSVLASTVKRDSATVVTDDTRSAQRARADCMPRTALAGSVLNNFTDSRTSLRDLPICSCSFLFFLMSFFTSIIALPLSPSLLAMRSNMFAMKL